MMKHFFKISMIILLVAIAKFGCEFAPGSYPYAEYYKIEYSESDIINAVKTFKEKSPENTLPDTYGLKDGQRDSMDNWYHLYFFYPLENEVVKAWVNRENKNKTTFALVSINQGTGEWKRINKDFSKEENTKQKRKFEERILNKIKEELKVDK